MPGRYPVLPVLVHGDAAFAGQGVVAETLELSQLRGYRTGGTVHLVINNQLGFTTPMEAARSSVYPTDVAKTVQAPIFHVNGDDPEACVRVGRLAVEFRQQFHKDVVIDMVCYRLHGHNEGDDPSYTQPLMYKQIDQHRSVRKLYTETLVKRGDITIDEAERALEDFSARLQAALDETRAAAPPRIDHLPASAARRASTTVARRRRASTASTLDAAARPAPRARRRASPCTPSSLASSTSAPSSTPPGRSNGPSREALASAACSPTATTSAWPARTPAAAPSASATRCSSTTRPGPSTCPSPTAPTFAATARGERPAGRFMVYDSLLSEYAALGFEYGYSVESSEALVAWEAQFGDFANGAQIVIDNFLAAAGDKWGQNSALTLLLPHGYEGQGPEHSSARLERFLTMCADGNLTVAQPTTAAQYFHLLRAQALRSTRRPLVVMTPKSLLRARQARSPVEQLVEGRWREVLDDDRRPTAAGQPRRAVQRQGRLRGDGTSRPDRRGGRAQPIAVARVEQLYPVARASRSPSCSRPTRRATEVVWLQEEPENMGAWSFVHGRLHRLLADELPAPPREPRPLGEPGNGLERHPPAGARGPSRRSVGQRSGAEVAGVVGA